MPSRPLLSLPLALVVGCTAPPGDDDDSAAGDPIPAEVQATVLFAPALAGDDVSGIAVTWNDQTEETDVTGRARLTLPSQTDFALSGVRDGIVTTWVEGSSGIRDFQIGATAAPESYYDSVVAGLSLPARDPTRGTLVVRLDSPALQAAMGASASLSAGSDDPWVVVQGEPQLGSELIFGAADAVTFSNVAPGAVTVDVTPPDGSICLSFPGLNGLEDHSSYTVRAGAVTTAWFICQ